MRAKMQLLHKFFLMICSLMLMSALTYSVCIVLGRARGVFHGELCRQNERIATVSESRNSQKRNKLGGKDKKGVTIVLLQEQLPFPRQLH